MAHPAPMVWLAGILCFAAGSVSTLAVTKTLSETRVLDPGDLPGFEERFVREFDLPEAKHALVRTILRDYREKRRLIEGQAASIARDKLERAGREADAKLRGILPPPQRARYEEWLARATDAGAEPAPR
jgi:hypothetical protein